MNCAIVVGLALVCFVPKYKGTRLVVVTGCALNTMSSMIKVKDKNSEEKYLVDSMDCSRIGIEKPEKGSCHGSK